MSKQVTVEELRERPEALIDAIENGETVTITREGKEIAVARPLVRIVQRGMPYPFRDVKISPLSRPLDIDAAAPILEERERERSEEKWRS